ncbi:MAG TPA: glycosyltransferase [Lacisediminihabitans sp.]|uniref:glycosyltransferase family 2 protein n=1 Tax=Lacisediminihabitans sp. TaxID=2787631 RepID=UPI002ED80B52
MSIDWPSILDDGVIVVLLLCVAAGTLPVISTAFQFLVLPFHAFVNHYGRAAPYTPNVAVIVPAWNEGPVVGASIDRLLTLDYPQDRLRIYVVDDASTDDTPEIVRAKERENPGRVFHLRREQGGEGKAHTLNHGISRVLASSWAQAILIMDADVIFARDSVAKMTRHLADPRVGAVTAYIAEGSRDRNYLTRFIAIEYVLGQLAARRAQNVLGAIACLAGGAQLHSRENLEAIGGRIPTGTLAEDTMTTFESQLHGRRMVFEPHALVLAEEPRTIDALWKQRLRWARGNVQLTRHYRRLWFRPRRGHRLGSVSFGLMWFSTFLLPVAMLLASFGLVVLLVLHSDLAATVFRIMWVSAACTYLYSIFFALQLDARTGRHAWREALLFPGVGSFVVMVSALFPGLLENDVPGLFGLQLTASGRIDWTLCIYVWGAAAMLGAWLARAVEGTRAGRVLAPLLLYLVGYGSLLCAITIDSYVKEWRKADTAWIKTEKVGRVVG